MTKKIIGFSGLAVAFILIVAVIAAVGTLNHYQGDGKTRLQGPRERIKLTRDEKGMAYVHARSLEDALFAQGFASAQDRLFQMDLSRRSAEGRLAEILGPALRDADVQMRTIGFHRHALRHEALLDDENRRFFEAYAAGVNAYIENRKSEYPLEFRLVGYAPEKWQVADSLAILYLMGWGSAANINHEIIAQTLIEKVGLEKALEIFPVNVNPDAGRPDAAIPMDLDVVTTESIETEPVEEMLEAAPAEETEAAPTPVPAPAAPAEAEEEYLEEEFIEEDEPVALGIDLLKDRKLTAFLSGPARQLEVGSNNWVVSGPLSPNLKPVVSNDPHLSVNLLPGPLYPVGLFGPDFRIVGAGVAGIPGMVIGRNSHIAIGATNAYGDTQDLYIETVDPQNPGNYLEGGVSVPFEVLTETVRIKGGKTGGAREEQITIRSTPRGPVVSDLLPGLKTDKVVTLRWSAFETMGPALGLDVLFKARTVADIRRGLANVTVIGLNFVFADERGGFGWHTTGRVPIRTRGDGTIPLAVTDGVDDWTGYIPFHEMPHRTNPERGWLGTANHKVVTDDYPYYYSSYFSPYYRYERMTQVLDAEGKKSIEDHWALQRDIKNLMAERLAPIMAAALLEDEQTKPLGEILKSWDYMDRASDVAPAIFQSVYRHFANRVYADELGPEAAATMLDTYYFWQVRLEQMVTEGTSPWFDDVSTADRAETRDDLFRAAALETIGEFAPRFLNDPREWKWGRIHQMRFVNPIRRNGFLSDCLGGGSHPMDGSGETLYRAIYPFSKPYGVYASAAMRMVVDLGDEEKVLAVMPSGVSGRTFDRHFTDQVKAYMNGDKLYWWFSDEQIDRHAEHRLIIDPMH